MQLTISNSIARMTPSPSRGLVKSSSSHRSLVFHSEEWTARNLSSDYQEIQIRTLTAWVNAQLGEQAIIDMRKDLQDGRHLLRLLATVEDDDDDAPKPEKGRMRIHQLSNVAQALSFLSKRHDDVPDIGNEAIVNGDLKRTLALLFYIMTKYQFQPILDDPSLKVKKQLIHASIILIIIICIYSMTQQPTHY